MVRALQPLSKRTREAYSVRKHGDSGIPTSENEWCLGGYIHQELAPAFKDPGVYTQSWKTWRPEHVRSYSRADVAAGGDTAKCEQRKTIRHYIRQNPGTVPLAIAKNAQGDYKWSNCVTDRPTYPASYTRHHFVYAASIRAYFSCTTL